MGILRVSCAGQKSNGWVTSLLRSPQPNFEFTFRSQDYGVGITVGVRYRGGGCSLCCDADVCAAAHRTYDAQPRAHARIVPGAGSGDASAALFARGAARGATSERGGYHLF